VRHRVPGREPHTAQVHGPLGTQLAQADSPRVQGQGGSQQGGSPQGREGTRLVQGIQQGDVLLVGVPGLEGGIQQGEGRELQEGVPGLQVGGQEEGVRKMLAGRRGSRQVPVLRGVVHRTREAELRREEAVLVGGHHREQLA